MDGDLDDLLLTARAENVLRNLGIRTVDELCARSEVDLMRVAGLGRVTLRDIKLVLAEQGRSLDEARADARVKEGIEAHVRELMRIGQNARHAPWVAEAARALGLEFS